MRELHSMQDVTTPLLTCIVKRVLGCRENESLFITHELRSIILNSEVLGDSTNVTFHSYVILSSSVYLNTYHRYNQTFFILIFLMLSEVAQKQYKYYLENIATKTVTTGSSRPVIRTAPSSAPLSASNSAPTPCGPWRSLQHLPASPIRKLDYWRKAL